MVYEETLVSRGLMQMEIRDGRVMAVREALSTWSFVADGRYFYRFTVNVAPMLSSKPWKTGKTA